MKISGNVSMRQLDHFNEGYPLIKIKCKWEETQFFFWKSFIWNIFRKIYPPGLSIFNYTFQGADIERIKQALLVKKNKIILQSKVVF